MKFKLKFFGNWRKKTGKKELEIFSETNLSGKELIEYLNKRFPGEFNDKEINGLVFIEKENLKSKPLENNDLIEEGATVIFISILEGG